MQYALLIYETEADLEIRRDPEAHVPVAAAYKAFTDALAKAGAMRGGEALDLPETATTLVAAPSKPLVQDGPFADTKEKLGGIIVIEAANLDEAMKWAEQCPAAQKGKVEIRPVVPGTQAQQ
ncbi:MAG: YciI family protein [Myxococcota bacterium]